MSTFKRILAWIVVVLSVVALLAVLAGIVGSWVIRNKVTDITVNLLTVGETAVTAANGAVNRIDDRLDMSQDRINTLETNITDAGANLQENSLVGQVIANNISDELALSINEARATAVSIADLIFALNDTIETANDIPFVNLDGVVPQLISDAADDLVELNNSMTEFRTGVQERREERISNSVDFFTGLTAEMSAGVGDVQSNLNETSHELDELSERLAERKESLPRTFTLITVVVNLVLLFIALAFVSLLLHAWTFTKNPDQSLRQLVSTEPQ